MNITKHKFAFAALAAFALAGDYDTGGLGFFLILR